MNLTNNELNESFYEKNKDNYPDVSLIQMKQIISGPWNYTRSEIESGKLPSIRHKYFGTFQVYPGRAKNMLRELKVRFDAGKITKEKYNKLYLMIKTYIDGLVK